MTEDQTLEGGSRGHEKADSCVGNVGQELIPTSPTAIAKSVFFQWVQEWCVTIPSRERTQKNIGTEFC